MGVRSNDKIQAIDYLVKKRERERKKGKKGSMLKVEYNGEVRYL